MSRDRVSDLDTGEMRRRLARWFLSLVLGLAGIWLTLSLATYSRWDPSLFTYSSRPGLSNLGGALGAWVADLLVTVLGLGAWALPVAIMGFSARRLLALEKKRLNLWGSIALLCGLSLLGGLLHKTLGFNFSLDLINGGLLGRGLAASISHLITIPGAFVFTLVLMSGAIGALTPDPAIEYLVGLSGRRPPLRWENHGPYAEPTTPSQATAQAHETPAPPDADQPETFHPNAIVLGTEEEEEDEEAMLVEAEAVEEEETDEDLLAENLRSLVAEAEPAGEEEAAAPAGEEPIAPEGVLASIEEEPEGERQQFALKKPGRKSSYTLPDIKLLATYEEDRRIESREDLQAASDLLEQTLRNFSVKGTVKRVHTGPVVNMYEFEPAPGVKITKVVNLSEDLALALKARSVRIAPIAGKSALGIEVPKLDRETVSLREIIQSKNFRENTSRLILALGKDIFGNPIIADLKRMPHLLVAGATGSGKSVAVNSMVMSLLYRANPDEVKLLLIDPKILELTAYSDIPHLISPVITDPRESAGALRMIVLEMERRYHLLAAEGTRSIDTYNKKVPTDRKLPYIVVFIDELADLMLTARNEVEDSIARLAQKARASGIHLIMATQRPSVDVLTGVIKANFPARISFQVISRIDSRTILDSQGAEQLIGRGDMLFMLPGVGTVRIHGAFVSESEVRDVVDFIKAQGNPDYSIMQNLTAAEEEAQAEAAYDEERDELFWRAVEYAETTGEVSISAIQRRLKIGYNRAARIMSIMEEDGMVGPARGAGKPREFIGRSRG